MSSVLQDGAGRFIYTDGSMYEGEWKSDKRHGTVIVVPFAHASCKGFFFNDVLRISPQALGLWCIPLERSTRVNGLTIERRGRVPTLGATARTRGSGRAIR